MRHNANLTHSRPEAQVVRPQGLLVSVAERRDLGLPTQLDYPPGSLLVVGGAPALGKTTLIERVIAPDQALHLCPDTLKDDVQSQVGSSVQGPDLWDEIYAVIFQRAYAALEKGHSVVVQSPALAPWRQIELAACARDCDAEAHVIYLDGDRALCDAGHATRERQVPERAMDYYLDQWRHLRALLLDEDQERSDVEEHQRRQHLRKNHPEFYAERYGHGMELMCARGYRSTVVFDRRAVNALQRITFS